MTNLTMLFDEATADAPPSRLSVEDVFSAIDSRRHRRRLTTALLAAVVLATAGTITITANLAEHPPTGAAPPEVIIWAGRGDPAHLFIVKNLCGQDPYTTASADPERTPAAPEAGCHELLASGDNGATWSSRGTMTHPPIVLGGQTLIRYSGGTGTPPPTADPTLAFELSTDGGVSWHKSAGEGTPIDAVPPGGFLHSGFARGLMVFDPAQGRLRRLANQPTLRFGFGGSVALLPKGIWVSGLNPATLRPAVAVSHDGGATWTQRDLPGSKVIPQPTLPTGELDPNSGTGPQLQLIPKDDTTAYVTLWDGSDPHPAPPIPGTENYGWLRTYRSTDGGFSWQAVSAESTTPSYSGAWITTDGRIVVALQGRDVGGVVMDTYAASTDAVTYAAAAPPGLPDSLRFIDGSIAFTGHEVYATGDGWTWREVWHD